jgi:hypothetical protein
MRDNKGSEAMTITINAEPVNVTLESEKTALDVLNGLSEKLKQSGMLMTDFDLDGKGSGEFAGDELSALNADDVSRLDVRAARFGEIRSVIASEGAETAAAFERLLPDLEDTALNLQTGKDREALEAIRAFSEQAAAATRIFSLARSVSSADEMPTVGGSTAPDFFGSMNGILRELEGAFERKDSVLIGDIAEYEIAPRLRGLIAALRSLKA